MSLLAEGAHVVLTVADDGLGIAPELLPQIFDPFVQGERTLDRSQGGLGVGLTLVRRLVELHGGTVAAMSEGAGRGSTFTIRLTRTTPAPAPTAATCAPAKAVPRRILVIEDNPDARETCRMMLEQAGHQVIEADEGIRGLELLKSAHPDIAVIDVGLPGSTATRRPAASAKTPQATTSCWSH